MTSLSTLERAAADVISILKGIDEFSNARIAVIGGMALRKYLPNGRTTGSQDVDFIINVDSAPAGVKEKLLTLPNSPFSQQAQFFYYQIPEGSSVQIDITPGWQVRTALQKTATREKQLHANMRHLVPVHASRRNDN